MIEQMPNQWLLDKSSEAIRRADELLRKVRTSRSGAGDIEIKVQHPLSDDERERIAIEVMDLEPERAQAEYDRRVRK
jgi:hypothetical protein